MTYRSEWIGGFNRRRNFVPPELGRLLTLKNSIRNELFRSAANHRTDAAGL